MQIIHFIALEVGDEVTHYNSGKKGKIKQFAYNRNDDLAYIGTNPTKANGVIIDFGKEEYFVSRLHIVKSEE